MIAIVKKIISTGVDNDTSRENKFIISTNILSIIVSIISLSYAVVYVIIEIQLLMWLNLSFAILQTIPILLNRYKLHKLAKLYLVNFALIQCIMVSLSFGSQTGFELYFYMIVIGMSYMYSQKEIVLIGLQGLLIIMSYIILQVLYKQVHPVKVLEPYEFKFLYYFTYSSLFLALAAVVIYFRWVNLNLEDVILQANSKLQGLSDSCKKYLPSQLVNSIIKDEKQVTVKTDRKKLTIFFSDIKGFTEITDGMEPEELSSILNEYLSEMTKIANKFGGTIDKFIGDAMMVFFGAPEATNDKDHAHRCLNMALEMQDKMTDLKDKWFNDGIETPLEIRVGINTGITAVGSFGTDDRLSYTAIGGQVNLASRLEGLAEPSGILISHSTWALVKDKIECKQRDEKVKVKGINREILVYDVVMD
ncbi:adenylate/guanylate cyclase domain-containing protein [Spirochaetota bacterium]